MIERRYRQCLSRPREKAERFNGKGVIVGGRRCCLGDAQND
jgi:hypothetical protein